MAPPGWTANRTSAHAADCRVPILPLAPGVSCISPTAATDPGSGHRGDRLGRWILRGPGQPSMGTGQTAGAGVLCRRDPKIATTQRGRTQEADRGATRHQRRPVPVVRRREATRCISHILRNSGALPAHRPWYDINTCAVFAETDRNLVGSKGRLGVILPTGIATDATTRYFFKDLVEHGSIASLYADFENSRPLFEGVHRSFRVLPAHPHRSGTPESHRPISRSSPRNQPTYSVPTPASR